ncbi:hypothetical protein IAT38_001253 [Cryptococcus sp. DSM 104549]
MLRVLCFCGFTSNKYLFSQELSRLRRDCSDSIEFVVLEPPTVVQPADLPAEKQLSQARSSTGFTEELTPETTPRRWYDGGSDWHNDIGFADALAYVHQFLIENEPFDGFFGFSSGAVLAVVVAALLQNPQHYDPHFPPHPTLRPLKFFVSCAGFFPSGRIAPHPTYFPLFPLPASLATLHVIGKHDTLLPLCESLFLAEECCRNSRVEWHDGDHFVPMKAAWRGFFKAWMTSFSPGGSKGLCIPPVNSFAPAFIAKQKLLAVTTSSAVTAPFVPAPRRSLPSRPLPAIQTDLEPAAWDSAFTAVSTSVFTADSDKTLVGELPTKLFKEISEPPAATGVIWDGGKGQRADGVVPVKFMLEASWGRNGWSVVPVMPVHAGSRRR